METQDLIVLAKEAQKNAYAPYSNFKVGAALLTRQGNIYTGANVENSSLGLTVCAERIAVFKAVTAGERDFQAIAVAASSEDFIYPCGACLQVIAEFSPHITLIVAAQNNNFRQHDLAEVFPKVFSLNI